MVMLSFRFLFQIKMAESTDRGDQRGNEIYDEIIVPHDKVFYVRDYKSHIESMFDCIVTFGLVSKDEHKVPPVSYQWIGVKGQKKNCREAKV